MKSELNVGNVGQWLLAAVACYMLMGSFLIGCDSVTQPPPGPPGSSAGNWSNDFQRGESGHIWVVNGTWTKDGVIVFQDQRLSPEQFIQMLAEQGITTNTPISILGEPGATVPPGVAGRFFEAGYLCRFLSLPKQYWKWWRKEHAHDL